MNGEHQGDVMGTHRLGDMNGGHDISDGVRVTLMMQSGTLVRLIGLGFR